MIYFICWNPTNFRQYIVEWVLAEAEEGDSLLYYVCNYQPGGTKHSAEHESSKHVPFQYEV
jgi:hypothetical protein